MKIENKLRTAAELTVSMTIIAALLTACGGGGGGTAAKTAAATSTFNVTPGKGIMIGALVTIKDANGVVLGTATTTAAGVAPVQIPATAAAPFVVSVSCLTAACSYYDEKTKSNVPGAPGMPVLQAVVADKAALNIGVTAVTNAAAQYALNTGALLTPASIAAANDRVATLMGLPLGTNILTPPTIISNDIQYKALQNGTTAADLLANLSASFAMSASGVSAMQAISDYGSAWKAAAITPASGVIMPPSIDQAAMILATSGVGGMTGIPTATIPNVATNITATAAGYAASTTATNNFLTDLTTTGMREFKAGFQTQYLNGASTVTDTIYPTGITLSATLANGIYTVTHSLKELINTVWTAITGASNNAGTSYVLTAAGWTDDSTLPVSFSLSGNGTATMTNAFGIPDTFQTVICANDVSNTAVGAAAASSAWATCNMAQMGGASAVLASPLNGVDASGFAMNSNASGVQVTTAVVPTGTFPVASREYLLQRLGNSTADIYQLWNDVGTNAIWGVTDTNGVALTTAPTATTSFCASGYVLVPINPAPATGTDNFNVFGTMSGCTAASITAGLATPAMGTALLSNKTTGNAVVPTVGLVTVNQANLAGQNGMSLQWLNGSIIGVAGGKALTGTIYPAGTPLSSINNQIPGAPTQLANKTAADALMTGYGLTKF